MSYLQYSTQIPHCGVGVLIAGLWVLTGITVMRAQKKREHGVGNDTPPDSRTPP